MIYVWLGVAILLAILELMIKKWNHFFFVIGALFALIISQKNHNFFLQFGVFMTTGLICYAGRQYYLKKRANKEKSKKIKKGS